MKTQPLLSTAAKPMQKFRIYEKPVYKSYKQLLHLERPKRKIEQDSEEETDFLQRLMQTKQKNGKKLHIVDSHSKIIKKKHPDHNPEKKQELNYKNQGKSLPPKTSDENAFVLSYTCSNKKLFTHQKEECLSNMRQCVSSMFATAEGFKNTLRPLRGEKLKSLHSAVDRSDKGAGEWIQSHIRMQKNKTVVTHRLQNWQLSQANKSCRPVGDAEFKMRLLIIQRCLKPIEPLIVPKKDRRQLFANTKQEELFLASLKQHPSLKF